MADLLTSLSPGERMLVWRKRARLSQQAMAELHGLTRTFYGRLERDQVEATIGVTLGTLRPHEEAMILRRRAGMTQKEVASTIGLSRHWVSKMETGNAACERLREGVDGRKV